PAPAPVCRQAPLLGPQLPGFRPDQRKILTSARGEPNLSLAAGGYALFPWRVADGSVPALVDAMRALLRFFTLARLTGVIVALLVAALVALHWLAELYWFQALGYARVFWRLLLCQLGLFAAATCLVYVYAWVNLRALARHVDLLGLHRISTPSAAVLLPS